MSPYVVRHFVPCVPSCLLEPPLGRRGDVPCFFAPEEHFRSDLVWTCLTNPYDGQLQYLLSRTRAANDSGSVVGRKDSSSLAQHSSGIIRCPVFPDLEARRTTPVASGPSNHLRRW